MKKGLAVGIIALLIILSISPLVFGYHQQNIVKSEMDILLEQLAFVCRDRIGGNAKFEYYKERLLGDYNVGFDVVEDEYEVVGVDRYYKTSLQDPIEPLLSSGGLMNSSWPMYCHDLRHTGQSPYSTIDNPGVEVWRFGCDDYVEGGGVLDQDGNIYFGSCNKYLYSLYSNGTLRWRLKLDLSRIDSSPTIDDDGTIYIGSSMAPFDENYFFAINPNGTLKWKYPTMEIFSSPTIGADGIIYFGDGGGYPSHGYIYAMYPNGTLKWRYLTNHVVYSSPAIGDDGIIYCGSHDSKLYALYPNGTLKWKFDTGDWIRTSPCIGDDGTIYCVSLDNYLYAIYPNGTLRWKTNVNAGTSPTIGLDGTIYCGYDKLKAINPDGSLKWEFDTGIDRKIRGGTPCHSADGTIYFGTVIGSYDGGEIIAVNPDGTEKWRKGICDKRIEFAPFIAEDGTVYIGSSSCDGGNDYGYFHAFSFVEDNNPPDTPTINGPLQGLAGLMYFYNFCSSDPDHHPVSFFIDWGDGVSRWSIYYESNRTITIGHVWEEQGDFTIAVKARDSVGAESDWAYLEVTMPVNKPIQSYGFPLIQKILELFPNVFPIIRHILEL